MKEAGRIVGMSWQDFGSVYTDLLIKKLHHVLDDVSHPLHDPLSGQLIAKSGRIYLASFLRQFGITIQIIKGVRFQLEMCCL